MSYIQPLTATFLLLAIVGFFTAQRSRSRMAAAGILGLFLLSLPPVDWLLSRPLEAAYPVRLLPPSEAEAIVVLAGGVEPPHGKRPYALLMEDSYGRCWHAIWLYHNWSALPVVVSGGTSQRGGPPYALALAEMMQAGGVPPEMIWTETRSRNTHENAVMSAEVLRSHGVKRAVLVVEAQSMRRAEGCFRKAGITVVPAPSDYREFGRWQDEFLPSWKAIRRNEFTFHETAGLLWYRWKGWL